MYNYLNIVNYYIQTWKQYKTGHIENKRHLFYLAGSV